MRSNLIIVLKQKDLLVSESGRPKEPAPKLRKTGYIKYVKFTFTNKTSDAGNGIDADRVRLRNIHRAG